VTEAPAALIAAAMAGCQLIIGLDGYALICPPEDPACNACAKPADCPVEDPCRPPGCVDNVCVRRYLPPRTPCPGGFCDYNARCVGCISDAECGAQERCEDSRCQPIPPLMCDDGVENGDEIEIDCGGACPQCLALPCSTGSDCKSGFCADGVCCNAPCTDICVSCFEGDCINVPKYMDDWPGCVGGFQCNGGGECRLDDGAICVADIECVSAKCINMTCVP
jgi:hypothetical protein